MPGPGPSGGEVTPLSVSVHVFSGKVKRFTSPDPTHAQLLATLRSDADGFYALAGDGTWATVTVTDGRWTEHAIVDSSDAAF